MCGIAGAVGPLDAEVQQALARAHARQAHRGPDAEGVWSSAPDGLGVAFAHRRLAIIDLSPDGVQPMRDPRSGAVIVFNGEIYNFAELRKDLVAAGACFRSRSDTEVLLQAWVHWGRDCLARLRGMFAFAVWDPRTRRVAFARDRLGIKPLYLARVRRAAGELVVFASELRALLATGLVPRRLDETALQTFLWHGFVAGPQALVAGVQRLEPGAWLELALEPGLREQAGRFWSLPGASTPGGDTDALRAELSEAVKLRLVSDVPLGVFLSGGVDSSAVTALAAKSGAASVRTFNVSFAEARFDESVHARAVAERLGTDHTEVRLGPRDFAARLDAALGAIDQPTFDAINTYVVSRAVREAGITVALAGTGGDELFGGYASFREVPLLARLSRLAGRLPRWAVAAGARLAARALAGRPGAAPPQVRFAKLPDLLAQDGRLVDLYQLSYALFTPAFLSELSPDLDWTRTRSGLAPERAAALDAAVAGSPALHAISTLELASFIGERLLPDTDAASMAVALEVRVPLLDHRVVERVAAVDPARRFEPLGRKRLLRELALDGVDPALFERPKQGFVLPIEDWMRQALGTRVGEVLGDAEACRSVGLAPDAVGRLWRGFRERAPGIYWSRPWALFVLLDWCRREGVSL
jgi:asparagine synthase (glutamine-hydrolysing)